MLKQIDFQVHHERKEKADGIGSHLFSRISLRTLNKVMFSNGLVPNAETKIITPDCIADNDDINNNQFSCLNRLISC